MELNNLRMDSNGALYVKADQLSKNCILIVSDGQANIMPLPAYAKVEIMVDGEKVRNVKCTESVVF